MQQEKSLKWLFLDLNSYFASVEQQENKNLRGRPIVVVPSMTDATCAIAASYEAKAYGIKTGTKIYDAKKLCPDLVCILARHDVYTKYHHRILAAFEAFAPIHKVWSIDEFSSKLCHSQSSIHDAYRFAQQVKQGIKQQVGECLQCSIGLAANSLLAKIATNMQKPDGLVILHPQDMPHKISSINLTDIPGIGMNMMRRLERGGIYDLNSFLNLSPKHARKIWGSVQGERLWYWLHGYDFDLPDTQKRMIGHSRVLDPIHRNPDSAKLMARQLLVKASYRLRNHELYAGKLTLSLSCLNDYRLAYEEKLPRQLQDQFSLLSELEKLWQIAMLELGNNASPKEKIKKVSVILTDLKTRQQETQNLFFDTPNTPPPTKATAKQKALSEAIDRLQEKYKKQIVQVGVSLKTRSGNVGTKIAFNRVPNEKEFWS